MMWKKNLHLRVEDKHIIRDPDGMLTDAIMHAANKLLAVQFPHLQDLQTTLLSQTSFSPIQESGGFLPDG